MAEGLDPAHGDPCREPCPGKARQHAEQKARAHAEVEARQVHALRELALAHAVGLTHHARVARIAEVVDKRVAVPH